METKFGKWLKSRSFSVFFFLIIFIAFFYMGFRLGNLLAWGFGINAYLQSAILSALLLLLSFSLLSKGGNSLLQHCRRISAYVLCFLLYDILALLVMDLVSLILRLSHSERAWLILSAACIAAVLLCYGRTHAGHLKTVSYSIQIDHAVSPLRIVLLSDLHIGLFVTPAYIERVVERVNALLPDIVLISGDLFDGYLPDTKTLHAAASTFRRLHPALGLYAVTGNHDPSAKDENFLAFLKSAGICLIDNELREVAGWNLVGRSGIVDQNEGRVPLCELLAGAAQQVPAIVLDHDPQGIREAETCGASLVLCGHTHRGQFSPMTLLTKLANGKEFFYGHRFSGKTHSIISAGTGFFSLPIRIGSDSEIVVIQIQ